MICLSCHYHVRNVFDTLVPNKTINITDDLDFLKQSYLKVLETGNGLILFINVYKFSLIWSKSAVFLCDSHRINREGFMTPNGTSILLKFKCLKICRGISQMYTEYIRVCR